jgi:two-component system LytT family response regulator
VIPKLLLPTSEGLNVLEVNEIISVHVDGGYCNIFNIGNERLMISKNLKEFEALLDANHFARVHQSYLINLSYVKTLLKEDGGMILMKNGIKIPLARRRMDDFLEKLMNMRPDW